jgi:hypothetical protein
MKYNLKIGGSTMSYKNLNATLSEEDKELIKTKIMEADALLPFVVKLKPEERKSLSKMGKKTIGFVETAMSYATNQPGFIPAYIDLDEKKADMTLFMQLVEVAGLVASLHEKLRDTLMVAGAEAYLSARVIYDSAKLAVKSGQPGSETASKDLGSVFKRPGGYQSNGGDSTATETQTKASKK